MGYTSTLMLCKQETVRSLYYISLPGHVNFLSSFFFFSLREKAFSSNSGLKKLVISQCFERFEITRLVHGSFSLALPCRWDQSQLALTCYLVCPFHLRSVKCGSYFGSSFSLLVRRPSQELSHPAVTTFTSCTQRSPRFFWIWPMPRAW